MFRIAILLAPLLSYALAVNGGIAASVSSVGVNYVVSQVIPLVEAELEKTTIPGISGTTDGFGAFSYDYVSSSAARCGLFPPCELVRGYHARHRRLRWPLVDRWASVEFFRIEKYFSDEFRCDLAASR